MNIEEGNLEVQLNIIIFIIIIMILCKVATGSLFILNPVLAPQVILPPPPSLFPSLSPPRVGKTGRGMLHTLTRFWPQCHRRFCCFLIDTRVFSPPPSPPFSLCIFTFDSQGRHYSRLARLAIWAIWNQLWNCKLFPSLTLEHLPPSPSPHSSPLAPLQLPTVFHRTPLQQIVQWGSLHCSNPASVNMSTIRSSHWATPKMMTMAVITPKISIF